MIDINVRYVAGGYKELTIEGGSTTMCQGLLSEAEAIDQARELIDAAYSLLPVDKNDEAEKLLAVLEEI